MTEAEPESESRAEISLESSPDPLLDELRADLPGLVDEALALPDIAGELNKVQQADRDTVLREVRNRTLAAQDDILRDTNPEIYGLRHARRLLNEHQEQPPQHVDRPVVPRDKLGNGYIRFAVWLGLVYPVLSWQLAPVLLSIPAFRSIQDNSVLIYIGLFSLAFVPLRWASAIVTRAGLRVVGRRIQDGILLPLAAMIATTYLLLVWQLGTASVHGMGLFLAIVIWVVTGLFALVSGLGCVALATATPSVSETREGSEAVSEPRAGSEKPGSVPGSVAGRAVLVYFLAVAVTYVVLSGVVPLPWPSWVVSILADGVSFVVLVLGPLPFPSRVPRQLSRDPDRHGTAEWNERRSQLQRESIEARKQWRVAAERTLVPTVLRHLNETVHPPFSTTLSTLNRAALRQIRAGERAVSTAASNRLLALTAGVSGGAVGMAGPRGVGKSTLLDAFHAGKFLNPGQQHIAIMESVPVNYEARDFVLHLFARTCTEVIGFCDGQVKEFRSRWPARRARLRQIAPVLAAVAAWLMVGFGGYAAIAVPRFDFRAWLTDIWGPVMFLCGAASVLWLIARKWPITPEASAPTPEPTTLQELREFARSTLDGISFQQKYTSGWSGKVSLPFGSEAAHNRSQERTRQPRSYPEIVHEFGAFLRTTIKCVSTVPAMAEPAVVIILDELDKIFSPDRAQDFINEVKALFNLDAPGFLFLISVSEDALASFERRGLPVRDAFDSAFDAIVRIEHLTLDDARAVLNGRILGMPEPFIALCHCMSGGLPRELIRIARQVTAQHGNLADVSRQVVGEDLRGKVAGLRTIIARGEYDETLASELVRHVGAHSIPDPTKLVEAAGSLPVPPTSSGQTTRLQRLQLETLGYLYYLGTVLEVFGPRFTEDDLTRGRDSQGDASFDTLSSVPQLFAVNARLAWSTISAFRTAWTLSTVEPPGLDPGWRTGSTNL